MLPQKLTARPYLFFRWVTACTKVDSQSYEPTTTYAVAIFAGWTLANPIFGVESLAV